jgi:hypothetical protein
VKKLSKNFRHSREIGILCRIKHTHILDDPFDDPAGLAEMIPDRSPELKPPSAVSSPSKA